MGFFERPDPRLIQSADPAPAVAVLRVLKRHAIAIAVCSAAIAVIYGANLALGLHDAAQRGGMLTVRGLYAPVRIARDRRDVPHIDARNEHDLFFAEGYVQGSDRLFQLDITRRFAYGRLAEVLGPKALALDEAQRAIDIDGIAARQVGALSPADRAALIAFSDGVNAALGSQPLPVEFRMLLYSPAPWKPKDSVAVSILASLELSDSWHDIFARDAVWQLHGPRCFDAFFPLSDARYDVTVEGHSMARRVRPPHDCGNPDIALHDSRHAIGSNAWGAGAARTRDGHALLANDPHLDVTIPGIWYLVDIRSPQIHAAGAAVPGMPGVVLGHNERLAWASTNAEVATTSLFEPGPLNRRSWVTERFDVRFSRAVDVAYYRTAREFSVPNDNDASQIALVRWPVYAESHSTIATILGLDRARDIGDGLKVLANYPGSPQNFILADRSGAIAYHVAGLVPDDPAWGRYVHPPRDLSERFAPIAFTKLPARGPMRGGVLISANNRMYGTAYPYRLSPQFAPPYRAYRIAELLRQRPRYTAAYFAGMQLDTLSPIDLEIARDIVQFARRHPNDEWADATALTSLQQWDGRYAPNSHAAALEHALRVAVLEDGYAFSVRLDALRNPRTATNIEQDLSSMLSFFAFETWPAWRKAGGMRVEHLLAPMHFAMLDGAWLPGAGDEYTIHLQEPAIAQSFRAVWDVGDWDQGGISIPSGESGEPGSGHYTDLTRAWIAGELQPLPFSRAAVHRDTLNTLVLVPR